MSNSGFPSAQEAPTWDRTGKAGVCLFYFPSIKSHSFSATSHQVPYRLQASKNWAVSLYQRGADRAPVGQRCRASLWGKLEGQNETRRQETFQITSKCSNRLKPAQTMASTGTNCRVCLGPQTSFRFCWEHSCAGHGNPRVFGEVQSLAIYTPATTQQQGAWVPTFRNHWEDFDIFDRVTVSFAFKSFESAVVWKQVQVLEVFLCPVRTLRQELQELTCRTYSLHAICTRNRQNWGVAAADPLA